MSKLKDASDLHLLREARKRKELRKRGGVYLTIAQLEDYRKSHCPGCGHDMNEGAALWFGEYFCAQCAYKFSRGK